MRPFNMATDGPTGREPPASGRDRPPPMPSTTGTGVADGFVEMVDWRRCAMRVRMTPETGEVSSGSAFSSAILTNKSDVGGGLEPYFLTCSLHQCCFLSCSPKYSRTCP